jgi:hypothetical protein
VQTEEGNRVRKTLTILAWLVATLAMVVVITLPVSLQVHLVTAVVFIFLMSIIKVFRLGGLWRLLLLALGTAIVLRYAYWRTTSTLPPIEQWGDFIPAFLLYLAELYCIMMLALSLFVVSSPMAPRKSRRLEPGAPVPTVDVFVPTYNEDYALLAGTLSAAKGMDYPADKLTVWLLDDGGTLEKRNSPNPDTAEAAQERYASAPNSMSAISRAIAMSTPRPATSTTAWPTPPATSSPYSTPTTPPPATSSRRQSPTTRTIRSSSSSRPRTSSSIPIRSSATCAPSSGCRPRTRCSTASSSVASTSGTPPSSAAPPRSSAAKLS